MLCVYLNPSNIFWWRLCIFYLSLSHSNYKLCRMHVSIHFSSSYLITPLLHFSLSLHILTSNWATSAIIAESAECQVVNGVNVVQLCTFRRSHFCNKIKQQKFQNFWQVYAALLMFKSQPQNASRKSARARCKFIVEWERRKKSVNIKWIVPVRAKRVWDILFITCFRHVNGIARYTLHTCSILILSHFQLALYTAYK